MAGLIKNLVGGFINAATATINPFKVQIVSADTFLTIPVVMQEGCVYLYKRPGYFECVIKPAATAPKCFSLFRQYSEVESRTLFGTIAPKLDMILQCSSSLYLENTLQRVFDCFREHPTWTAVHVAAYTGLWEIFKHEQMKSLINTECRATGVTPLMACVKGKQPQCIQELLIHNANIGMCDKQGSTVYHHAVTDMPTAIPLIIGHDAEGVINWLNGKGETALFLACSKMLPDATDILIHVGADPAVSTADCLPVHAAARSGDLKSLELIVQMHPNQISAWDNRYQSTPLHWAANKEVINLLSLMGCDINAVGGNGFTALHVMMTQGKIDCCMELLCHGADVNVVDANRETVLHWAVQKDDVELVRTYVVYGANVNLQNRNRHSARHLISVSKSKNRDLILYLLHISGAKRCRKDVKGCMDGCVAEGTHNGSPDKEMKRLLRMDSVAMLDELLSASVTCDATIVNKTGSVLDMVDGPLNVGDRVLCLDGGGIRGLILIQMLMEIETVAGRPIKECFDWICGTSTGGILALGIARGFPLQHLKGLYFRLKDEVFKGKRPYSSEPFEQMLKREFGEDSTMAEIKHPKVLVTGVLADRQPAELHMFRNYHKPLNLPHRDMEKETKYPTMPGPEEQKIWLAARCSGAAPTYFRAHERILDGGLIANNPTLDLLTEIHEYNVGLKQNNQMDKVRPLGCVISLGTGRMPQTQVNHVDVFRPENLFDAAKAVKGASTLGYLLINQATLSEGRPVDRARAWCSMINVPYFRFSPQLSEDVPLDCHDNRKLINMMWETHCYMVANQSRLQELASLIKAG
ncbi:85/88 kDa calcium-independent phospholipase A2-like [Gigantopelta aegis]|uniref:85/88 kDa calcium-independent phospholipase A2-like n=1 Tax=Gigantopelta aegis TaxID=1735272 RepID=UPI001B88D41B|nr:85/88 kDa calcium-independent phospholipase A2-like [Gigantopelta aegis]